MFTLGCFLSVKELSHPDNKVLLTNIPAFLRQAGGLFVRWKEDKKFGDCKTQLREDLCMAKTPFFWNTGLRPSHILPLLK